MPGSRLYFLDNFRATVIFIVVLMHVSLSYMMYAPSWWYVVDPERSIFFTMIVALSDVPIMHVMFFIAGYFALPSLNRHGLNAFLEQKIWRIFLPWVIAIVFIVPQTAFMIPFTRNVPVDFFTFYTKTFWTEAFQHSVYWFLSTLFWMFVGLAFVWKFVPALRNSKQVTGKVPLWLFPLFIVLTGTTFFIALQCYPLDGWFFTYLISFQQERIVMQILYFSLGIWAWKSNWFIEGGYSPRKRFWVPVLLVAMFIYINVKLAFATSQVPLMERQFYLACIFSVYCFAFLMAGLAVFKTWINGSGRFWSSAARNSYGIYYLHGLIAYWSVYALIPVGWSIYMKAALIFTVTVVGCWFLTANVLRKAPGLKRMF